MAEPAPARSSNTPSDKPLPAELAFELLLPCEEHARLVLAWRNDPLTRQWSYSHAIKQWPDFFRQFCSEYFTFIPPLFVLCAGRRVAFLRFRPTLDPQIPQRRCCDVSIIVAPEQRGRGIATASLLAIRPWLISQGYQALYAEVFKGNIASRKAFEKAGFLPLPEETRRLEESREQIAICRFIVPLIHEAIWQEKPLYIIAEAGSNWRMGTPERDKAMALTLIDIAATAGADAIKFQLFRSATIYAPDAGSSGYLSQAGIATDMGSLFRDLELPYEMVAELSTACHQAKIDLMITPFSPEDFAAVDPHVTKHKIASYELNHIHLLNLAARSHKPLLLSTGASTEGEIAWAVEAFRSAGGQDLTLMQCTASYPASPQAMNLQCIPWLKRRFGVNVGLSDHSRHPTAAPIAAVALGARVIEKHFTLDNRLPGPDHAFALMPEELTEMVKASRAAEQMLGAPIKVVAEEERELRAFARRGIQALRPIDAGEPLHEGKNIGILRPGQQPLGVHPKYLSEIEGTLATRPISAGEGIQFGDFGDFGDCGV